MAAGKSEKREVAPIRLDGEVRRGLAVILEFVIQDFDNGFDQLLPDGDDGRALDVCKAMQWLEQRTKYEGW